MQPITLRQFSDNDPTSLSADERLTLTRLYHDFAKMRENYEGECLESFTPVNHQVSHALTRLSEACKSLSVDWQGHPQFTSHNIETFGRTLWEIPDLFDLIRPALSTIGDLQDRFQIYESIMNQQLIASMKADLFSNLSQGFSDDLAALTNSSDYYKRTIAFHQTNTDVMDIAAESLKFALIHSPKDIKLEFDFAKPQETQAPPAPTGVRWLLSKIVTLPAPIPAPTREPEPIEKTLRRIATAFQEAKLIGEHLQKRGELETLPEIKSISFPPNFPAHQYMPELDALYKACGLKNIFRARDVEAAPPARQDYAPLPVPPRDTPRRASTSHTSTTRQSRPAERPAHITVDTSNLTGLLPLFQELHAALNDIQKIRPIIKVGEAIKDVENVIHCLNGRGTVGTSAAGNAGTFLVNFAVRTNNVRNDIAGKIPGTPMRLHKAYDMLGSNQYALNALAKKYGADITNVRPYEPSGTNWEQQGTIGVDLSRPATAALRQMEAALESYSALRTVVRPTPTERLANEIESALKNGRLPPGMISSGQWETQVTSMIDSLTGYGQGAARTNLHSALSLMRKHTAEYETRLSGSAQSAAPSAQNMYRDVLLDGDGVVLKTETARLCHEALFTLKDTFFDRKKYLKRDPIDSEAERKMRDELESFKDVGRSALANRLSKSDYFNSRMPFAEALTSASNSGEHERALERMSAALAEVYAEVKQHHGLSVVEKRGRN